MKIIIRNAELTDCEPIAGLSRQLGYESDDLEIKNRLSELLENPDHRVFVATENDKTIGWIHGFYSLRVESGAFVEIGGLVVDKNNRKKGVGKMLVDSVIQWAESINFSKIRVRCNTKRVESHQFYQKIGFDLSKEQKIFDKKLK